MKRFFVTHKLLVLYIAILIAGVVTMIVITTRPRPVDERAALVDDVRTHLADVAKQAKTEQSYSTLTQKQRPEFLKQQAVIYAIEPQGEALMPDTLRGACVEWTEADIITTATRLRNDVGPDDFKEYVPLFTDAKRAARANCYASFDPTGVEDVPPMMAHP